MALEQEGVGNRSVLRLSFEQRVRLRQIFEDPVFVQAWQNAQACRPSVIPQGLDTALGLQIGNNRLHQIQGWELFRTALIRESMDPLPTPPRARDDFPDSGTLEAEIQAKINRQQKSP